MAAHLSPVSDGDSEFASRLHHDLNRNPPRASTKIFKSRGVLLTKTPGRGIKLCNPTADLPQTPESILSESTSQERVAFNVQSSENSSLAVPARSPSSRCSAGVVVHSIKSKANGIKRKLGAIDAIGTDIEISVQESLTGGMAMGDGKSVDASEPEPPRKRLPNTKRISGYVKYHQSMQDDKPKPFGNPPVWAEKRQNLCEALPYYKAYMSGAYIHDGLVSAFLVDKEVGPRDKFDDEVIITRVGGGRRMNPMTGIRAHTIDQDVSCVATGFERAKNLQLPIAMIAGQGNTISPSKMPHYYNVLDWFQVTDVWCERYNGFRCWMVRVEKIRLSEKSWWAPIDWPLPCPDRNIHAFQTTLLHCDFCGKDSKEIYRQGWTCLETSCRQFFKFSPGIRVDDVDYNEEFLKERTDFDPIDLPSLAPLLYTSRNADEMRLFGYEPFFKRGIVCPLCNGCARRIEWHQWRCETPNCAFTHKIRQDTMSVRNAISNCSGTKIKELCNETFGIRHDVKRIGLYNIDEFIIPSVEVNGVAGIIMHFKANDFINAQQNGPNQLFYQMQQYDFGLKRHPARQNGAAGEILTSHWAANWGAPYKYGVSVLSKGFDEAPSAIIKALKRLTWAGEQTLTADLGAFHAFNELLSIGYFEESAIGYHDDGEKELGPTVATLSLGADAIMSLRPKAKSGLGPKSKNAKGTKLDVLRFKISHGDIVIMHGSGIQKLYEHAVSPNGKLRFALTCRYVRPELMANDSERQQAEIKAKLPDGHENFSYDGEAEGQFTQADSNFEHLLATQRAVDDLSTRIHSGELSEETMQEYRSQIARLVDSMDVPNKEV